MSARDTDTLRAVAERATPGDWREHITRSRPSEVYTDGAPAHTPNPLVAGNVLRKCDAKFIAAANPAVILSLLSRLERYEKALGEAQAIIDGAREDLHHQRATDWHPEGVHDAATSMSESMRLIGNRLADADLLAALNKDADHV